MCPLNIYARTDLSWIGIKVPNSDGHNLWNVVRLEYNYHCNLRSTPKTVIYLAEFYWYFERNNKFEYACAVTDSFTASRLLHVAYSTI